MIKKINEVRGVLVVMRKKQVLVCVLAAIIGTAAMVNYNSQPGVEVSGEIVESDGGSKYVTSLVDNLDAINSDSSELSDAYFVSARLERDRTFGEQIEIQENILYNEKADENSKKIAQEQINAISNNFFMNRCSLFKYLPIAVPPIGVLSS